MPPLPMKKNSPRLFLSTVSPLQGFVEKWRGCILCNLWEQRDKIVLGKGDVPAEILIVGEAPGDSEDITGKPFVGPAGQLLMDIMRIVRAKHPYRVAYTNLVCCFPRIAKRAGTNEPSYDEIHACAPRLKEFIEVVQPLLLVIAGKLTEAHIGASLGDATLEAKGIVENHPTLRVWAAISHPAHIVRMPLAQKGFAADKCEVTISQAIRQMEDFIPKQSR